MATYEDMRELLEFVAQGRAELEKTYEAARRDPDVKAVLRPTVKSSLEHLRSTLEYSAQTLRTKYCRAVKPKENVYFPFAETESVFQLRADSNLPGLKKQCPDAYAVVVSVQPFKCGDLWLKSLCDQTNFNKHHGLSDQARVNSASSTLNVGRLARISAGSSLKIGALEVNGKAIGNGKPIIINDQTDTATLQQQLGNDPFLKVSREYEWVKFLFAGSAEDTLALIGKSHDRISAYTEEIRPYL
jgi:hypothetical protein